MDNKKRIVIAGAGSGIGKQICQTLLTHDYNIIAIGRTDVNLPKSEQITFIEYDFSTDMLLPEIEGRIDGLVYCPGSINLKPFSSLKETDILNDLTINVLGAFRLAHKYHKNLNENSGIVFFSSVAAQTGMPFHTSISISKAAVEGLTKSLAAELAPKIRVNCIAPSLTDTPLAAMLLNSDSKRLANAERHPLKKIGETADVAELAIYLLNAKWMTGQVIGLNGGLGTILK
ncbi:SDR family NAD(P)-dependent oxidoreductase [Flavobacterium sp.]